MKTILLEVDDSHYQTILNFIQLLPKSQCRVLNDNELSSEEYAIIDQIEQGDYSAFEDWEIVKARL